MALTAHAAGSGDIAIHLSSTELFSVAGIGISNTLMAVWLAMIVLIGSSYLIGRRLSWRPGKVQIIAETLVGFVHTTVRDLLGSDAHATRFLPLILTLFLFILTVNWVGLLPGVESIGVYVTNDGVREFIPFFHPGNTDLNMTIALALISFVAIQISGFFILGFRTYGSKFLSFKSPIAFIVGIIELISEFSRIISFAFRLFGNIFAGSVLILVVATLVPYIAPVPLLVFELFVGLVQAFIFATLTLFFIKIAITADAH
ncbi:MAG: F0F1 ATP synthase subunit A [Candidatus Kaiserbacteria bacterium]|nr:F0F1 ATP synthase subunit A [Candidatus Kaiserbacteria bacterium]